MQQLIVVAFLLFWLALSGAVSHLYTAQTPGGWLYLTWWLLIFTLPFLLRPAGRAERWFRPELTLISHCRKRARVHLAPCQPTAGLTPERVSAFWCSVNTSTCRALTENRTVIIASHLLTARRARRLLAHLEEHGFHVRYRVFSVPFTPALRAVMQLEILFRQWRWLRPSRTDWPVMVIRERGQP